MYSNFNCSILKTKAGELNLKKIFAGATTFCLQLQKEAHTHHSDQFLNRRWDVGTPSGGGGGGCGGGGGGSPFQPSVTFIRI